MGPQSALGQKVYRAHKGLESGWWHLAHIEFEAQAFINYKSLPSTTKTLGLQLGTLGPLALGELFLADEAFR